MGVANKRYTDYELRLKTNLPVFRVKESSVRRRYSDFEWLKNELERDSKIVVPPLPSKALKRQMPFRADDGIYEEGFIEDRRSALEAFINKIAGHPLAQNERFCTCSSRRRTLTGIMCLARLKTPEASLSELPWHCRLPLYSSCSFIAFINHHESTYLIS